MIIEASFDFNHNKMTVTKTPDGINKATINIIFNNYTIDGYMLPTIIYENNDMLWYKEHALDEMARLTTKYLHRPGGKPAVIYLLSKSCMWAYDGKFYIPSYKIAAKIFLQGKNPFEASEELGKYYLAQYNIKEIKTILENIRSFVSREIKEEYQPEIIMIPEQLLEQIRKFVEIGV